MVSWCLGPSCSILGQDFLFNSWTDSLEPPSPTSTCGSDALDDLVPSLFIFGLEAIFGLLEAILRLLEGILRLLEGIFGKFCFAQKLLRNARLCKIEYLIF